MADEEIEEIWRGLTPSRRAFIMQDDAADGIVVRGQSTHRMLRTLEHQRLCFKAHGKWFLTDDLGKRVAAYGRAHGGANG